MNDISVSLILTTWNGDKTLKRAIESLKKQTYKSVNFFVSDDASTDSSKKIISSEFEGINNSRILFRDKNIGGWKNFISQVHLSEDIYLCWVCQDDQWDKDFVKELVHCAKKFQKKFGYLPSLVGCGTILFDQEKVLLKKSLKKYNLDIKNSNELANSILIDKKDMLHNKLNLILHGLIKVKSIHYLVKKFPLVINLITHDRHFLSLLASFEGIATSEKYLYLRDVNMGLELRQKRRSLNSKKLKYIKKPKFLQKFLSQFKALFLTQISCLASIYILLFLKINLNKKCKLIFIFLYSIILDSTFFFKRTLFGNF